MEKFNDNTGQYENDRAINLNIDEDTVGTKLATDLNEKQGIQNRASNALDMSQVMLDSAIQAKAEYEVKKNQIRDNKNLNDVERNTRYAVLNNESRTLDLSLELAQKNVDDDMLIAQKANGKLVASKSAYDAHLSKMHNTPTPDEIEQMKSIPRTKLTPEQKEVIIDRMGFEFYNTIPLI